MDSRYQLGSGKQWTHLNSSTPTLPPSPGRLQPMVQATTLQLLAVSVAASVDQMFNTKTSPSAFYMPPMIAALTSFTKLRLRCG